MRKGKRSATPVEYSLLLTATLCLLAFGVVMVFSASSTTQLLGESGDSAFYLKRTLIFGALGLLLMHLLARRGIKALRPAGTAVKVQVRRDGLPRELTLTLGAAPLNYRIQPLPGTPSAAQQAVLNKWLAANK